jgi:hypothetical protein
MLSMNMWFLCSTRNSCSFHVYIQDHTEHCNQIAEENAHYYVFYMSEANEHTVKPSLFLRISHKKNAESIDCCKAD